MSHPTTEMIKRVTVSVGKSTAAKAAIDATTAAIVKALKQAGVEEEFLNDSRFQTVVKLGAPMLLHLTCSLANEQINNTFGEGTAEKMMAASIKMQEVVVTEIGFKVVDELLPMVKGLIGSVLAVEGGGEENPLQIMGAATQG